MSFIEMSFINSMLCNTIKTNVFVFYAIENNIVIKNVTQCGKVCRLFIRTVTHTLYKQWKYKLEMEMTMNSLARPY